MAACCDRCGGEFEGDFGYEVATIVGGMILCLWCAARLQLLRDIAEPQREAA